MELEEFHSHLAQSYYILSHRWEEEEITYEDMMHGQGRDKKGYGKIEAFCEAVRIRNSTLGSNSADYVWVDTCCIDKKSSAELSEAINSMYKWYQGAEICYAYLSDVETLHDLNTSLWFTRSWTLQELIAPNLVEFYNRNWWFLGSRGKLARDIAEATSIDLEVLTGGRLTSSYSIAQRMSWAAGRQATRPEDEAYSLMGLFDVNMPMLYGEGEKAFIRLQEEIIRRSDDHTIFAWNMPSSSKADSLQLSSMMAESPHMFKGCKDIIRTRPLIEAEGHSITNIGLSIRLLAINWQMDIYCAILECTIEGNPKHCLGIFLRHSSASHRYARVSLRESYPILIDREDWFVKKTMLRQRPHIRKFLVHPDLTGLITDNPYGFRLGTLQVPTRTSRKGWLLPTKIMARSTWQSQERIAYMPTGEMGTACLILFDSEKAQFIKCITLGFDNDFNAVVKFSTRLPRSDGDVWSNNWLRHSSDTQEKAVLKPDGAMVVLNDFDKVEGLTLRASRATGLYLRFPRLQFSLKIVWTKTLERDASAWNVTCGAEQP